MKLIELKKYIRKDILILVLPILIEQIFINSMNTINTMMASRLNEGKVVIASIGIIDPINNLFISFFSALAIGATVVVAQLMGQGNRENANDAAKQSLIVGVLISLIATVLIFIFKTPIVKLLFGRIDKEVMDQAFIYLQITLLSYPLLATSLISNGILRGSGDTKTPAKVNIVMNIVNIVFTAIFLYVLKLGVAGAALGLTIARLSGALIVLVVLLKGNRGIKIDKLSEFKFNKLYLDKFFNIGIPAGIESILFHIGKISTKTFIAGMGVMAVNIDSLSNSITTVLNIPGSSLSMAATTVVGQTIGKGEIKEAKKSLMYMTKFALICLVILGAVSVPLSRFLVSLYTKDQVLIAETAKILILNAIATPLWAFSFVLPNGLKGAGDGKYSMYTNIIGMWIFRIGLGYLLGVRLNMGVAGVCIGMYVDWAVRGSLYMIRLRGTKWCKNALIKSEAA